MLTTPMPSGAGWWMEMPYCVDPERLASVEISGRLTAEAAGRHQLGIRGIGELTLMAGERKLFDEAVWPDVSDFATLFLAPPENRMGLDLAAGESVDVSLRQRVTLQPGFAMVSLTLGYSEPIAEADDLLAEAERVAAASDVAVVVVGTTNEVESEGFDRTSLALPGRQDELVRRVAAANSATVVVVNAGSPVDLPWADDVAAVLLTWFPGQEAGHALADVLFGVVEPGGPDADHLADTGSGLPDPRYDSVGGIVAYDEGVFIGYRAWDRGRPHPDTAFGHGLGYTTWNTRSMAVDELQGDVTYYATRDARPGREVVAVLRLADRRRPVPSARWLAGFAVVTADPDGRASASIDISDRSFQIWAEGAWRTATGRYEITVAHSIAEPRLSKIITIG